MVPRVTRDFMLGSMEREAAVVGAERVPPLTAAQSIAMLRLGNKGYRQLKEEDERIIALRALL